MNKALAAALAAQDKTVKKGESASSEKPKSVKTSASIQPKPEVKEVKKKKKKKAIGSSEPVKAVTNARAAGLKPKSADPEITEKPNKAVVVEEKSEPKQRGNKGNRLDLENITINKGKFDPEESEARRSSKWDKYVKDFKEVGDALFFPANEVTVASLQNVVKRYADVHDIPLAVAKRGDQTVLYRTKEATTKLAGAKVLSKKTGEEEEE